MNKRAICVSLILIYTAAVLCGCREQRGAASSGDLSSHTAESTAPASALISTEHICQLDSWPTGCESVSAVMALRYAGIEITVDDFIDNCLICTERPFNPNKSFGGDPRSTGGKGCYAPVIKAACDKLLTESKLEARVLNEPTVADLCEKYVARDIPVVIWATLDMAEPFVGDSWEFEGKTVTWIRPEHCLLLVGYNSESYIFRDPMHRESVTYYSIEATETAYKALFSQAVVIEEKQ